MLDRVLMTYLRPDAPRIMPKLRQAMYAIDTYVEEIITRYIEIAGAETSGMFALEQILGDVDLRSLRKVPDDVDRYFNQLLPLQEDLIRHLDPSVQGVTHLASFISTTTPGREYLLPVMATNYITMLPLNKPWEEWEKLRPLALLYSDNKNLSLDAKMDRLRYINTTPNHTVISLDAIMLIMQYAKYLDTHPPDQRLPIRDYLHRYVIYPALIKDSITVWMLQQYTNVITDAANSHDKTIWTPLTTATMGSFGVQLPAALEELWNLTQVVKDQNLLPSRFLSSLLLEKSHVTTAYGHLRKRIEFPQLRQYIWMQYISMMSWRNLVFATMDLTRKSSFSKWTRIQTQREYHLLRATRFWTTVSDKPTQDFIFNDFQEKLHILDSGW